MNVNRGCYKIIKSYPHLVPLFKSIVLKILILPVNQRNYEALQKVFACNKKDKGSNLS